METQMIQAMKRDAARKFAAARREYKTPGANRAVLRGVMAEARWAFRLARNELKHI